MTDLIYDKTTVFASTSLCQKNLTHLLDRIEMLCSQTPKKSVVHGSTRSDQDPIPHVCFLVDGHQQSFNTILKQQLVRLLLLFHTQINPNFTWSFEFISKKGGGIRKLQRTNLGLDDKSLQLFDRELYQHQKSVSATNIEMNENSHSYTVIDLVDSLRILAVQKRWDSSPATALNQSPFKLRDSTWINWQGNVKLRNYLVILSPLPSANGKQSLQYMLGNHCPTEDIQELLEIFRAEFLEQNLWTNLVKSRIALYWIDPFTIKQKKKVQDIDASVIDLWTMSFLRIFGGACINRETLLSTDICLVVTNLFPSNVIDLSSVHQLFMPIPPKSKRDSFLEVIEKSLLPSSKIPKMWSGRASLDSQISDLFTNFSNIPAEISFVLTAASLTSHQGEAKRALEGCKINILKIIPKQLVDPERASFHCICSGSLVELETFSGFMSQLTSHSCALLIEIIFPEGDKIEAVLRPNFSTLAAIQILPYPLSTEVDWVKLKENISTFENDTIDHPSPEEEEIISLWFSKWDRYLSSFLQTGKILPGTSSKVERLCMGIWTLQKAQLEPTPKKKSIGGFPVTKNIKEAIVNPVFELEKFASIDDALNNVMYYYNCILYGKYPITFFHEHLFPSLYTQLIELGQKEKVNPMDLILKYFIERVSITIEEIESRHASRLNSLFFLIDHSASCTFDAKMKILIQNWFVEKKQKYREQDVDVTNDLKSLLKNSIKELRKLEAQLQIIVWMECLRISNETQSEIPMKSLYKEKKSKKKKKGLMKDHVVASIHILTDKLLIWTAGFESSFSETNSEGGIWGSFVKPVLVANYQLHFSDLITTIVSKTGGEEETEEIDKSLASPFFKKTQMKRPLTKPKIVEKGKVQKALSRKALLEKRIVAEKPIAKKRRTECSLKKNDCIDNANDQAMISMDQFFKPKTPLTNRSSQKARIFVPETPGENAKNVVFDAISTPSRKRSQNLRLDLFSPIWQ